MLIPSRSPLTTLLSADGEGLRRAAGGGGPLPAPTITSVTFNVSTPNVAETITADVEGANISTVTGQWKADGVDISGATNLTYTPTRADAMGHALTFTATAHNATGDSSPFTSDPTNTCTGAPQNDAAPLNESSGGASCSVGNGDTLGVGASFLGNVGTWSGFPAQASMTFSFLWNDAAGTTFQSFAPGGADIGNNVKCTVRADNGIGGGPVSAESNDVPVVA